MISLLKEFVQKLAGIQQFVKNISKLNQKNTIN